MNPHMSLETAAPGLIAVSVVAVGTIVGVPPSPVKSKAIHSVVTVAAEVGCQ